jgi:dCTP deaminase
MILSDLSIREALAYGKIKVDPKPEEIQIQPASLDLRLGKYFTTYLKTALNRPKTITAGVDDVSNYMAHVEHDVDEPYHLEWGGFVLATTLERVELPADIVARIEGRSSLGRLGITAHITAGYIDPGFKGNITLEIANFSPHTVVLTPGMRICQLSFHTMTCAAREPYGTKKGSKYQNQDGPVPSRIHKDE